MGKRWAVFELWLHPPQNRCALGVYNCLLAAHDLHYTTLWIRPTVLLHRYNLKKCSGSLQQSRLWIVIRNVSLMDNATNSITTLQVRKMVTMKETEFSGRRNTIWLEQCWVIWMKVGLRKCTPPGQEVLDPCKSMFSTPKAYVATRALSLCWMQGGNKGH